MPLTFRFKISMTQQKFLTFEHIGNGKYDYHLYPDDSKTSIPKEQIVNSFKRRIIKRPFQPKRKFFPSYNI